MINVITISGVSKNMKGGESLYFICYILNVIFFIKIAINFLMNYGRKQSNFLNIICGVSYKD